MHLSLLCLVIFYTCREMLIWLGDICNDTGKPYEQQLSIWRHNIHSVSYTPLI